MNTASTWCDPAAATFPGPRPVGSRITFFEACSAFTHVTACLLAKSPEATLSTRGSGSFVTSTAAPIATGWSDLSCRAGLSPADFSAFALRTMNGVEFGVLFGLS